MIKKNQDKQKVLLEYYEKLAEVKKLFDEHEKVRLSIEKDKRIHPIELGYYLLAILLYYSYLILVVRPVLLQVNEELFRIIKRATSCFIFCSLLSSGLRHITHSLFESMRKEEYLKTVSQLKTLEEKYRLILQEEREEEEEEEEENGVKI